MSNGNGKQKKDAPWPVPPVEDLVDSTDEVWLKWIDELKPRDWDEVLRQTRLGTDPSVRLIYERCGMAVLVHLWKNHMSSALYISEAPLNELRKRYIRRFYDPKNPETGVKVLAHLLRCSEQFVRESLMEDPKENPMQEKMKL